MGKYKVKRTGIAQHNTYHNRVLKVICTDLSRTILSVGVNNVSNIDCVRTVIYSSQVNRWSDQPTYYFELLSYLFYCKL